MHFRYRIDGIPSAEGPAPLLEEFDARVRIVDMRQWLRFKIAMLSWACGCSHEQRLKDHEDAGGQIELPILEQKVFCPENVNGLYPNCAHAATFGHDPDPYGPEIRELIAMQALDAATWNAWLQQMRFRILAVDTLIGNSIHGGPSKKIVPLPHGVTPSSLQMPNLQELQVTGWLLLQITGEILDLQAA